MLTIIRLFMLICLSYSSAIAVHIETFYGLIDVEEPVVLELIESPAFQRLKNIHQYGVSYYTTHREELTRYEHSLGVFALLRAKGCSLEEQIAGLLHDVSHTIFSHVGDWIFNRQNQDVDYQSLTHLDFLEKSGLAEILRKYEYVVENIQPKQENFPALEQPLPTLCADRLDYNIQGAFHQNFITKEEAISLFQEIQFINGEWVSSNPELLTKLSRYSIFMTQDCWGSPTNYMQSMWLAEAVLHSLEIEAITMHDIRFGIDNVIWSYLLNSTDPFIKKNMQKILNPSHYYRIVSPEEADFFVTSKFRGINPLMWIDGKYIRLIDIDPALAKEFQIAKEKMHNGWAIKLVNE